MSSGIINLNYHNYQIENDWYESFYVSTLDGTKKGLSFLNLGNKTASLIFSTIYKILELPRNNQICLSTHTSFLENIVNYYLIL